MSFFRPIMLANIFTIAVLLLHPVHAEEKNERNGVIPVELTAQAEQNKARLEIKWPELITYSLIRDGIILRINFDKPFKGNTQEVQDKLKDFVTRIVIDHNQTSLLVYIPEQFHYQSLLVDPKTLAIDIFSTAQNVESSPTLPKQSFRAGRHKNFVRLVFDWDQRIDYKVKQEGEVLVISFNHPLSLSHQEINKKLPKGYKVKSLTTEGQTSIVTITIPAQRTIKDFYNGKDVVVDVIRTTQPTKEVKEEKKVKLKSTAAPNDQLIHQLSPHTEVITLDLTLPPSTPHAFFQRGKNLWLVIPQNVAINEKMLDALKQAGFITHITNNKDFQALVLAHHQIWVPKLDPTTHQLTLWDKTTFRESSKPASILSPSLQEGEENYSIELQLARIEPFLSFKDPILGDEVWVITTERPDYYIDRPKEWSQLRLLDTIHGLAFIPLSDNVNHHWDDANLTIMFPHPSPALTEEIFRNETELPDQDIKAETVAETNDVKTILLPNLWARGSVQQFVKQRQTLQHALAHAVPEEKKARRLDLAQFYFAHGMMGDTLGLLRLNEESKTNNTTKESVAVAIIPDLQQKPVIPLMKAAALYWSGQYQEALDQIQDQYLDLFAEAWLWRAACLSQLEQWDEAQEAWGYLIHMFPAIFPEQYSRPFQFKLGIPLAEMLLAIGDDDNAQKLITYLEQCADTPIQKDNVIYLSATFDWLKDESALAHQKWQSLKTSLHPLIRVKAELASVEAGLSEQSLKIEDALQRLEKLRFTWRGDRTEFKLLHRLGNLYINTGYHRTGLTTLRTAMVQFPDWANQANIPQQMQQAFVDDLTNEETTTLDPVKKIALFHEFQELVPSDTTGNQIIHHIAHQMIDLDLWDQAAALMDDLIDYRLQGQEKIKTTLALVDIYLEHRKPDLALDTLKKVAKDLTADMPLDLDHELRLVTARTMYELGHYEDALKSLDPLEGTDVILLRAEINWHRSNWPIVAQNYATLVASIPAEEKQDLKDPVDRWIFLWALSLAFNEDDKALKKLNEAYGTAMRKTLYADSFNIIAQTGASAPKSFLHELAKHAGPTTIFQDHLRHSKKETSEESIKPTSH